MKSFSYCPIQKISTYRTFFHIILENGEVHVKDQIDFIKCWNISNRISWMTCQSCITYTKIFFFKFNFIESYVWNTIQNMTFVSVQHTFHKINTPLVSSKRDLRFFSLFLTYVRTQNFVAMDDTYVILFPYELDWEDLNTFTYVIYVKDESLYQYAYVWVKFCNIVLL